MGILRHSSGKGSVICENDVNILVFDAKFRTTKRWGTCDLGSRNVRSFGFEEQGLLAAPKGVLDIIQNEKPASLNTDILVKYQDSEAALWCRKIGCSLPNAREALAISKYANALDSLDPTISRYPEFALGSANPRGPISLGESDFIWTSTEFNQFNAICVGHHQYADAFGKLFMLGVVPIIEL